MPETNSTDERQPRSGLRIIHDSVPTDYPEAEAEDEEPYYQDIAERQIARMRRALTDSSK